MAVLIYRIFHIVFMSMCEGCFLVPGPHALAQETGKLMVVVVVFQGYGRLCCPGRSLVTTNPSIDNKLSK